jgi:hypothetical protein
VRVIRALILTSRAARIIARPLSFAADARRRAQAPRPPSTIQKFQVLIEEHAHFLGARASLS